MMDRTQFRVIRGGGNSSKRQAPFEQGPISRLDLWDRFQPSHSGLLTFAILSKVALIATLIYFVWGR